MAMWAIVRGALEIAAAIRLRHILPRAWLLAASGAASVLFGVLLLLRPVVGLVTLVYLVGAAALVFGIMAIALALHLRRLAADQGTTSEIDGVRKGIVRGREAFDVTDCLPRISRAKKIAIR